MSKIIATNASIVNQYLAGVYERLPKEYGQALQEAPKASSEDMKLLLDRYPQCPNALMVFLSQAMNGTYHKNPSNYLQLVPILGSDVGELPYYLLAIADILEVTPYRKKSIHDIYGVFPYDDLLTLDPRVDPDIPLLERLCFAHCINNGGFSKLYIDFHPKADGVVGQVVRFLHDPDDYSVIASSFEEYLHKLIEHGYAHLTEIEEFLEE